MPTMKNFRKSISSTKRNNLKLFVQLSVVMLFAVVSLLVWRTAAQMQDKNNAESLQVERFSINGTNLQPAILSVNNATDGAVIPTLGNYPNTTVAVGSDTTVIPDAAPTGATSINVSTDSDFKGVLVANPTTGVVRITNAHPAGIYLVTVKAFKDGGMSARTFTLTVISGTVCNGTVQYTNAADVGAGANPRSVAIGDFNNDGNQDVATANFGANTVSIRLGNGSGGFSGTNTVNITNGPQSIAIGDFNNDGNQDFATANTFSNTVSTRLGDGLGNFSGTTDVSVGTNPISVAIGDFNKDGIQDFATANFSSNNLSIRLGGCIVTPTPTPTPTPTSTPTPTPTPTPQTCTPFTTVTEGDLFPGGIVSFGVAGGLGSVTVDHVNAGTGLQSFTVVGTPKNAVVNIPAFTPGTFAPVTVTFTRPNPALAVDFTLRAASTFHAANIRVRCLQQ